MNKKISMILLLFTSILNIQWLCARETSSDLYMNISGRVIDKEKSIGISGILIRINNSDMSVTYSSYTDNDGTFIIKGIVPGHYIIDNPDLYGSLYRTNNRHLIPDFNSDRFEFDVEIGKNISNLNIYLKRGSSISGFVYCPDGITPISEADIIIKPIFKGQIPQIKSDKNGKFEFVGIKKPGILKFKPYTHLIQVIAVGYSYVDKYINIDKDGDNISDCNFILGKGPGSIEGRVISKSTGNPISGAEIIIVGNDQISGEKIGGQGKTNSKGEYRIIGFRNKGEIDIGIYFNNCYNKFIRKLDSGVNYFDFELNENGSNQEGFQKKKPESFFSGQSSSFDSKCDCGFRQEEVSNAFKNMCALLANMKNCLLEPIYTCIEEKCNGGFYKIWCNNDCQPTWDYFGEKLDIPCGKADWNTKSIEICINVSPECNLQGALEQTLAHEFYHICDFMYELESEYYDECKELNAYTAQRCIFNLHNANLDYLIDKLRLKCKEQRDSGNLINKF